MGIVVAIIVGAILGFLAYFVCALFLPYIVAVLVRRVRRTALLRQRRLAAVVRLVRRDLPNGKRRAVAPRLVEAPPAATRTRTPRPVRLRLRGTSSRRLLRRPASTVTLSFEPPRRPTAGVVAPSDLPY
jgi:hypothetical protein